MSTGAKQMHDGAPSRADHLPIRDKGNGEDL